jgi:putative restriction endonuclease
MKPRASNNDVLKSDLLAHRPTGAFSAEVKAALEADPALVTKLASLLLEQHFPESLHPDIPDAIGLTLSTTGSQVRDSKFRQRILGTLQQIMPDEMVQIAPFAAGCGWA